MRPKQRAEDRRRELRLLARDILASRGQKTAPIDLRAIAGDRSTVVIRQVDLRGECDGLLRWHEGQGRFHLFYQDDPFRHRFNLAHEVAHLSIDWHCEAIRRRADGHKSNHRLLQHDPMEREADFLAGCLLIPDALFDHTKYEPIFRDAEQLKEAFDTSLAVAIRRIIDCTHIRSAMVVTRNGRVAWSHFSDGMAESGMGFIQNKIPIPDKSVTKRAIDGGKPTGTVEASVWFDRIDHGPDLWEEYRDFSRFGYGITILSAQDD